MSAAPNRAAGRSESRRPVHDTTTVEERPVVVTEAPRINGPFPVKGNPIMVRYEIVACMSLPAADTDVVPSIYFDESSEQGKYVDVRWTTTDMREPRGVWERATVLTLPKQFAIKAYTVTGDAPLLEREAGA